MLSFSSRSLLPAARRRGTAVTVGAPRTGLLPGSKLVGLLLLLAGCETLVEVPEPKHEPSLAISYVLDTNPAADSLRRYLFNDRRAYINVSQRLYDETDNRGRFNTIEANIEVRDETGGVVERYGYIRRAQRPPVNSALGYYRPLLGYTFLPGRTYRLRVEAPDLAPAESTVTLPVPVDIEEATVTQLAADPNDFRNRRARVTVSFTDPGGSDDYYVVYARALDKDGKPAGQGDIIQVEEATGIGNITPLRLSSPINNQSTFPLTDSGYDGRQITLINNISYFDPGPNWPDQPQPKYLELTVTRITRELYLFYNSRRIYNGTAGNPFAEPTPLHNNIQAGFGIFGGAADAIRRLPL